MSSCVNTLLASRCRSYLALLSANALFRLLLWKVCSICNRDRIPPWLLDVHGCVVLPGAIVRCPRVSARYHPPPPPPMGLISGVLDTIGRSQNKGRPLTPPSQSPSNTPRTGASAVSTERSGGTLGRRRGTTTPTSSPIPVGRSSRRALGAGPVNGATSPPGGKSPRNKAIAAAAVSQQQQHTPASSPTQNRTSNKIRKSPPGGGLVSSPRRGVKGRTEAAFEAATAAMKSKFEGLPGDCTFMVVAVHGMRSQPPRIPRSLEGYCVVVSDMKSAFLYDFGLCQHWID